MTRIPPKVSYRWTEKKLVETSSGDPSRSSMRSPPPGNLFANTLSIIAVIVSAASAWYTIDSEKRIALDTIRSQNRAILYIGDQFTVLVNDQQTALSLKFQLNNFGQTSAKNVKFRYSAFLDKYNEKGDPPQEWPQGETFKIQQVEKTLPMTLAIAGQTTQDIQDVVIGQKAIWTDVGVSYEDEWGNRYETTKCFAIIRDGPGFHGQLCNVD